MNALLITIFVITCIALITLVLLQSGKEDMGVIFGGGSGSVFGSTGAGGLLVKVTAVLSALFLICALGINYISGTKVGNDSIMLEGDTIITPRPEGEEKPAPAVDFETTTNASAVTAPAPEVAQEAAQENATEAPVNATQQ